MSTYQICLLRTISSYESYLHIASLCFLSVATSLVRSEYIQRFNLSVRENHSIHEIEPLREMERAIFDHAQLCRSYSPVHHPATSRDESERVDYTYLCTVFVRHGMDEVLQNNNLRRDQTRD